MNSDYLTLLLFKEKHNLNCKFLNLKFHKSEVSMDKNPTPSGRKSS